jgi:hypothetical protein
VGLNIMVLEYSRRTELEIMRWGQVGYIVEFDRTTSAAATVEYIAMACAWLDCTVVVIAPVVRDDE